MVRVDGRERQPGKLLGSAWIAPGTSILAVYVHQSRPSGLRQMESGAPDCPLPAAAAGETCKATQGQEWPTWPHGRGLHGHTGEACMATHARAQGQGPGTRDQGQGPGPGIRARDQGPGARGQGPGTRDQGPGTRDQGPGTRGQGPGTTDQGPGARGQEPGTRDQGTLGVPNSGNPNAS